MRVSLVVVPLGIALLALGIYLVSLGVGMELAYHANSGACTTAPNCGSPPPPYTGLFMDAVPFLVIGITTIAWGITRVFQDRRRRGVLHGA